MYSTDLWKNVTFFMLWYPNSTLLKNSFSSHGDLFIVFERVGRKDHKEFEYRGVKKSYILP